MHYPYCKIEIHKFPKRKTKCSNCSQYYTSYKKSNKIEIIKYNEYTIKSISKEIGLELNRDYSGKIKILENDLDSPDVIWKSLNQLVYSFSETSDFYSLY